VPSDVDILIRLATAGGLGMAIGLEREARGHAAGIRTHALVALGAALFTVAGAYGFADVAKGPNVDPARVAAQIASGVGFLGAGAIIRDGASVRGLTTAATLWFSAAVGLAAGAGFWFAAVVGTAMVFATVVGLRAARPWLLPLLGAPGQRLQLEYMRGHGTLGPVMRGLEDADARVDGIRIEDDDDDRGALRRVEIDVSTRNVARLGRLVDELQARDEVRSATWIDARRNV
jgi:putative Mg2+ transporter-C (MgtC) family protein